VDSILDKESYSLEELLDEDELIQECKSLNARLTAYLKQRDTVEKLVRACLEGTEEQQSARSRRLAWAGGRTMGLLAWQREPPRTAEVAHPLPPGSCGLPEPLLLSQLPPAPPP
jgi:hypothetical protein